MMSTIAAWTLASLLALPARPAPSALASAPAMIFGRVEAQRANDAVFRTVYGTALAFGGEARVRAARRLYIGVEAGFLRKTGALTVTGETTTLTTIPISGMVVVYVKPGRIAPYVAGGATACRYSETNFIGSVSEFGVGFAAAGGVTMPVGTRGVLDARLKYTSLRVKPLEDQTDLGGLSVGIAAGVRF